LRNSRKAGEARNEFPCYRRRKENGVRKKGQDLGGQKAPIVV